MDMIERVAEAIAVKSHYLHMAHSVAEICQSDKLDEWLRAYPAKISDYERQLARVAIEAMREPTKQMSRCAADKCSTTDLADRKDFMDHYAGVWETMIDAALKS